MQHVGVGMSRKVEPGPFVEIRDVDNQRPAAIFVMADRVAQECSAFGFGMAASIHMNFTPGVGDLEYKERAVLFGKLDDSIG